ncbi:MAG: lysine--tRNA ligase, partial [Armatimonadetes bacterium]|nr:lysine--tRNA ligase [Armatimonadota bacterium]
MSETYDEYQRRLEKLHELKHKGQDPFGHHSYQRTHSSRQLQETFAELEGQAVSVAGRLIAMRSHGKSTFADLQDASGTIQIHARVDVLGEERYEACCGLDLGDIVGVSGELFGTRTGEVTIRCAEFVLLAKALRPLPEKFHGLQDPELRYRQRYLDLLANDE